MTYGVTPAGFVKRTLEDILAQYEADEIAAISTSLDVSSSSPMGQINATIGATCAEVWDMGQAVFTAMDPDKNSGDAQDAVGAITGTLRKGAAPSYVVQTLSLGAGVTVPAGSLVSVLGNPSVVFQLLGPEPAPGAAVVPGPVVSVGAGTYFGRLACTQTGPIAANAGTLTVIVTPVTGWSSTTNALDAVRGRLVETQEEFRVRREAEIFEEGSAYVDAIRTDLLQLEGMQEVTPFENDTDVTDVNGVPPHSLEFLCYDGPTPATPDVVIAQQLWVSKAGGIRTYGGTTANAVDELGNVRPQSFSRPTQKLVYFTIDVKIDASSFPAAGDALIKEAIVAKGLQQRSGTAVVLASFYPSILGVPGVTDIITFRAGFAPAPAGVVNLAIATRERATYDTSRIVINHV